MSDTNTNDQMNKMTNTLIQACADANNMMRDSMNAVMQSATILTKGCTDMCDTMSTMLQKSLEQSAKAGQAMMTVQTVHDIMDMHANLLKTHFDSLMSDMSNLSQMSSRVVQDASVPVTNQINDTISKLSKTTQAA